MSYSILQVKDDLAGMAHGTTVNKITNIDAVFRRAARNVIAKLNPDELKRLGQLEIYDGVYDYAAFSDLNEKRVADIRVVPRSAADNFTSRNNENFDMRKEHVDNWFSIEDRSLTKVFRLSKRLTPAKSRIYDFDETTYATVGGDASGLALDKNVYISGYALSFNLANAGDSGYIELTDFSDVDLSSIWGQSDHFVWVYIPNNPSAITSITLRLGNSNTAYRTITGAAQIGSLKTGWNLIKFDHSTGSNTGSITSSAIDYARLTFAYDGTAITGIRVDSMFSSVGHIIDILYYSKFMFRDSTGATWKAEATNDGDLVNLEEASYNIFLYEVGLAAAQQRKGADARADQKFFKEELYGLPNQVGLYEQYKFENPDQVQRPRGTYYRPR